MRLPYFQNDYYSSPRVDTTAGGTFHNDQAYEDPHIFNPDRYIQSEFGTKPGVDTTGYRKDLVFGFGRVSIFIYWRRSRICSDTILRSEPAQAYTLPITRWYDYPSRIHILP